MGAAAALPAPAQHFLLRRQCAFRGELWKLTKAAPPASSPPSARGVELEAAPFLWGSGLGKEVLALQGSAFQLGALPAAAVSALVLANIARTLVGAVLRAGQITEHDLLVAQCPPGLPTTHLRLVLRWLCACGILDRRFSLLELNPPPTSLFSQDPDALQPQPTPRFLVATAAALGTPALPALEDAVRLWEAAPFLGLLQGECSSSSRGSEALRLPPTRDGLLLGLHAFHSASPCPIPGLVTSYCATGLAMTRLAALINVLLS